MGTPFVYGRIADKNNFTNRKKEVELLKRNCRNENKTLRMNKLEYYNVLYFIFLVVLFIRAEWKHR